MAVTQTTLTSAGAWSPDLHEVAPVDAVPDALVLSTSTVAGSVEGDAPSVRVQYVDDASAGFFAEGATIDTAEPDLSEALVFTAKVGQVIRLSREQWLQPNASNLLSASVARAVTKAANAAYIAQAAPTAPAVTPPTGLLNVTGIVNIGAVATTLDKIVDGLATLAGNDATPTHFVFSPVAWASLRKLKAGTALNNSLLPTGATDAVQMLFGLPVIVDNAVPSGSGLIIDRTAVVSAVGQVMVTTSEHAFFTADSIAVRCTWRFGATVVKPNRIGKLTVT